MKRHNRGLTLIELVVMIGVGGIVGGLVFDVMLETSRNTDELVAQQQMRQEAVLIAQSVDRVLRFKLPDTMEPRGGAGPEAAAGGTTSTLPGSIRAITAETSPTAGATTTTLVTTDTKTIDPSTAPPSVKALLTTGTAAGKSGGVFETEQLVCRSLAAGPDPARTTVQILNESGHVVQRYLAVSGKPDQNTVSRKLGVNAERFRTSISFRYAANFDGLNPKWEKAISVAPKLVEYTIRIWPNRPDTEFQNRLGLSGRTLNYELVGAVGLQ